jgi:hypothetical protein
VQVSEVFIEGTEPREPTILQDVKGGIGGLIHKIFGSAPVANAPEAVPGANARPGQESGPNDTANAGAEPAEAPQPKKKGALKKLLGVFKGGSKE